MKKNVRNKKKKRMEYRAKYKNNNFPTTIYKNIIQFKVNII